LVLFFKKEHFLGLFYQLSAELSTPILTQPLARRLLTKGIVLLERWPMPIRPLPFLLAVLKVAGCVQKDVSGMGSVTIGE